FRFRNRPVLAARIIFYLVALDLADAEITAFGVGIIEARHRRTGPHGETFRQLDADLVFRIQQLEQGCLLAVLGLGRIAWRGADALIFLADQVGVGELLLGGIAPIFLAHFLVQALGKSF